jgi:hypothetical protein
VSAKRALSRVRAPDEHAAEQRAWTVVSSAYEQRAPLPRRGRRRRLTLALTAAVFLAAVALSPAGATVGRLITRALGVQHAAPALFSLPAPGRLLVAGPGGAWSIAADGSTRRLGPWRQASWSPHGRYVAVAGEDRLIAVNPRGTVQWALARPAVSDPRWYPPAGVRVAYLSAGTLRVVAGDGSGDHLLAAGVAKIAPAWRPGHPYEVAYLSTGGQLIVRDGDTGLAAWSAAPGHGIEQLSWSADGQRLLALAPTAARVYSGAGKLISTISQSRGAPAIDGALSPDGHTLALVLAGPAGAVVLEKLAARPVAAARVLSGVGLRQVAWSPNGRWLLVSWPAANQWVFVRVAGAPRIVAVSRIAQQFSAGGHAPAFPGLAGWCCTWGTAR